MHVIFVQN